MAKEITLTQRAESLAIGITNRARNIAEYADTLEKMEKDLKGALSMEQVALFRLCIRSIKADCDSLANAEERSRV